MLSIFHSDLFPNLAFWAGGHHCDYSFGALSSGQVIETHLVIRYSQILSKGIHSLTALQCFGNGESVPACPFPLAKDAHTCPSRGWLCESDLWVTYVQVIHYSDVIMSAMASEITGVSIFCLTVCSSADQRKRQSSASPAFVRGIHRGAVDSPHTGPVTRKTFPFDDVIMTFCNVSQYWSFYIESPWYRDNTEKIVLRQNVNMN